CYIFFFQAEDGIRDKLVTGVQTCALPISSDAPPIYWGAARSGNVPWSMRARTMSRRIWRLPAPRKCGSRTWSILTCTRIIGLERSEERRVGKERSEGMGGEQWRDSEGREV